MVEVLPRRSFFAESLRLVVSACVAKEMQRKGAYTKRVLKLLRNVEARNLDSDLSTFELALVHRGWSLIVLGFGIIVAVALEFHRVGDQLVCAAQLA